MTPTEVRVDKWLWAIRVYRTRSQAIAACHAGHVRVDGQRVKPARPVRLGDLITAQVGPVCRRVRVVALLDRRVGAALVSQFAEDLTPPEEYAKRTAAQAAPRLVRPPGRGRPTKKERRAIDRLF